MKKSPKIALILFMFLPFLSCLEEGIPQTDSRLANISNLLPDSGYYGDTIRLTGSQLSEVDSLFLNGMKALVLNSSDEDLNFTVPFNSSTGPVSVLNPFGISIGPDFTVLGENDSTPQFIFIDSISPAEGLALTQVKLYGGNFGNNANALQVLLNQVAVEVVSVTDSEVEFIVGANSTTGNVSVVLRSDTTVGPVFTVLPPNTLSIQAINPDSGPELTQVLVTGTNFGNQLNDIEVTLNGEQANVNSVSNTEIVFIVPDGATTGSVVVSKISDGQEAEGPIFTVINPEISIASINPNSGPELTQVLIAGGNFGSQQNDIMVTLNGDEADLVSVSNTEIVFIVPDGATTGPVVVSKMSDGQEAEGPIFTVINPEISIASINPNSGPELTQVLITGENFGSQQNDIMVTLNGDEADLVSVSNTEIVFIVPDGATTGAVVVNKISNGQEAEGPVFTVTDPPLVVTVSTVVSDGVGNPFDIIQLTNFLLISDDAGHRIRLYDLNTNQFVANIGNGQSGFINGPSASAQFNLPSGMALNGNGNLIIADRSNHVIRGVSGGNVSTISGIGQAGFADGDMFQQAQYNNPVGVAIDGSMIYVADFQNHAIRRINLQTQQVSTIAGNGTPGFANGNSNVSRLNFPAGIVLDGNGNLIIADYLNHSIRSLNLSTLNLTTLAGTNIAGFEDGDNAVARFNQPIDVSVDTEGKIYVADGLNHSIRMIDNGETITLAGTGSPGDQNGVGTNAQFDTPTSVFAISSTEILVGDYSNNSIKRLIIE